MNHKSIKFKFPNAQGQNLSGVIEMPEEKPLFFAVFGPCFTCVKESHAAFKICRLLAERGVAALRFDTTGVGESQGVLAQTNFTTRIHDLIAANHALAAAYEPPKLLIGHSISGTAALSAAQHLHSLQAIATIGSPCDPASVIEKFKRWELMTEQGDTVEVNVLGKKISFNKSFVDDMQSQNTIEDTSKITQKLFVFHAPLDNIVAFDNAAVIQKRAGGEAELIALDETATHLLERGQDDAVFISETLMEWFRVHLK